MKKIERKSKIKEGRRVGKGGGNSPSSHSL